MGVQTIFKLFCFWPRCSWNPRGKTTYKTGAVQHFVSCVLTAIPYIRGVFETASRRRQAGACLYLLFSLLLGAAFAHYVIQSFHGPIFAGTDANIHTYQGYYILRYLHFVPWPKLDLSNDALFYPYGNDQVFQSWVFERDLFSAFCLRFFGWGPWVQIHYLASVLTTALGLFFLLRGEHSQLRAAFAGLAVAFCNYYPIAKFPGHANLSVLHWTMLGVTADYLIIRRIWRNELPGRLLMLRAALVFLALGQELGYVAGLSLTSFVLAAAWAVCLVWWRRSWPWQEATGRARVFLERTLKDLRSHPWQTTTLTVALAWAAFFYFPLVLQVFLHARKYPVMDILGNVWWQWANPLRIFVPIIPGLEPVSSPGNFERLTDFFQDDPEGFFAMSPGLFFVLLGALGVFLSVRRKNFGALAPILVLWLMVLANHPEKFPILRVFPWFAYTRTAAKLGDINCLALVLLGIGGIPAGYFSLRRSAILPPGKARRIFAPRILGAALALLFGTEIVTAYRMRLLDDRQYFVPRDEFYRFMETIRRSPGEALLEWPFCVASGNGYATNELGPYFRLQATLFCLSEFHGKKVMSGYYGRLFPRQVAPFFHAGWDRLFFPDHPKWEDATRQRHDFTAPEWSFFEEFFRKNDFCGLLLSTDFLPEETVREMHARFGNPVAVTSGGVDGRMEFIPRPAAWGRPSEPAAGKSAVFALPLTSPITHIDFTRDTSLDYLRDGWSKVDAVAPRYSDGYKAVVAFEAVPGTVPKPLTMDLFASTYEEQTFTLKFNGRAIKTWHGDGGEHRHFLAELPADAWREGVNEITFDLPQAHYPHWKRGRLRDVRHLGLLVDSMDLQEIPLP